MVDDRVNMTDYFDQIKHQYCEVPIAMKQAKEIAQQGKEIERLRQIANQKERFSPYTPKGGKGKEKGGGKFGAGKTDSQYGQGQDSGKGAPPKDYLWDTRGKCWDFHFKGTCTEGKYCPQNLDHSCCKVGCNKIHRFSEHHPDILQKLQAHRAKKGLDKGKGKEKGGKGKGKNSKEDNDDEPQ